MSCATLIDVSNMNVNAHTFSEIFCPTNFVNHFQNPIVIVLQLFSCSVFHFYMLSYQMTPDEDFILDKHPSYDNIIIGAGFSGMKFLCTVLTFISWTKCLAQ